MSAPGGWPSMTLLLNSDDPKCGDYAAYAGVLSTAVLAAGSRCADAHRYASQVWPDEPFYGLLCDDQWPITPGWWEAMEKAAEDRYVVCPGGEPNFPRCRTAVAIGGGLVRAMGSLVPAPVKHNFEDNIWDDVAREHNCLRPLPEMVVEHRHHIRGTAPHDETYARGSADFSSDQAIYEQWLVSEEKKQMDDRIRVFLAQRPET